MKYLHVTFFFLTLSVFGFSQNLSGTSWFIDGILTQNLKD